MLFEYWGAPLALVMAQDDPVPSDPIGIIGAFGGYGLVGIIALALMFGYGIVPSYVYKRDLLYREQQILEIKTEMTSVRKENVELKQTVADSAASMAGDIVPVLLQVTANQERYMRYMEKAEREQELERVRTEAREEARQEALQDKAPPT